MVSIVYIMFNLLFFLVFSVNLAIGVETGSIEGTVFYKGETSAPEQYLVSEYPNSGFCAKAMNVVENGIYSFYKVEVSKGAGLRGAIVAIKNYKDEEWMKRAKQVPVQSVYGENCQWIPSTGIAVSRGLFQVTNLDADPNDPEHIDGVLHQAGAMDSLGERESTEFRFGLAKKGSSVTKKTRLKMARNGSHLHLKCATHKWMEGWYLPVENPYYAASNEKGEFRIKNIPVGQYVIRAWHPFAGELEKVVDLKAGDTYKLEFILGPHKNK